jgi:hypothetical protein
MYSIEKIRSNVNRISKIMKNLDPQAMTIIDKQLQKVCSDLDSTMEDMAYLVLVKADADYNITKRAVGIN